jgi:hypothetical protein
VVAGISKIVRYLHVPNLQDSATLSPSSKRGERAMICRKEQPQKDRQQ